MDSRGSGILLHITSLPSSCGIGDLGEAAYAFVDFLGETGQNYWQILPLNLTCIHYGNSPYSSYSAFAGNPLLVSLEQMVEEGFLAQSDIVEQPTFPRKKVNFQKVTKYKHKILGVAYEKRKATLPQDPEFQRFCCENSYWLGDYALFMALKEVFQGDEWNSWPDGLRERRAVVIEEWQHKLKESIVRERFFQYLFFRQWYLLKEYCSKRNVQIIGDVPIYVNYDSSDVWSHQEIFKLDRNREPLSVTGVPPDYFSSTGQLWGHPVYDWAVLKDSRYAWWIQRMEHNLKLFHLFRLDHFRGFVGYWEIPADEKNAINGKWEKAPAKDFFRTLLKHFPSLPIIAEDLGVITPDVREIVNLFGFPGMRVLLFAFGDDVSSNAYAPHNYIRNCVVYTGTHDNNTVKGWFRTEADAECKKRLSRYLGYKVSEKCVHWELIRLAMGSIANLVIVPMQDILGLGEAARMNLPSTPKGNWEWRFMQEQITPALIQKLSEMTEIYGRA
ncbi:MAG: 4-alpha-glucanotransferase [Candidatus Scalindua sp. AMX11]|nr:MAG: 4-alpha-glucanotransferase [Candidatus Scalindua sp.]NOG85686.1 4-alpha-glucanotransferase [Planctomycetota bacterium]RZV82421.1 MAG: 4-alpha-glucanotransferase [Candidatus Scalindua sp. SCAELEC01]TDE65657.1 MAG: 4-alpha-glucanotransferase [Candidatus Scalindua sp. AMX11]GJQ59146.1 MAG: 4-alpha-glucanotransferase [Candidatus Scalindua sp.]